MKAALKIVAIMIQTPERRAALCTVSGLLLSPGRYYVKRLSSERVIGPHHLDESRSLHVR